MGQAVKQFVFVRLHAREGEESAVEEALREVIGPSRAEAGLASLRGVALTLADKPSRGGPS